MTTEINIKVKLTELVMLAAFEKRNNDRIDSSYDLKKIDDLMKAQVISGYVKVQSINALPEDVSCINDQGVLRFASGNTEPGFVNAANTSIRGMFDFSNIIIADEILLGTDLGFKLTTLRKLRNHIEKTFEIQIEDSEEMRLTRFENVVGLVSEKLVAKPGHKPGNVIGGVRYVGTPELNELGQAA